MEAVERGKNEDERGKDPGGGDEPDAEHGEGEEGREHRSKVPPAAPSERERRLHRITHFPFRSWCPECVAGKGVASGHCRSKDPEAALGGGVPLRLLFSEEQTSG